VLLTKEARLGEELTTGQLCDRLDIPEHTLAAMIRARHVKPTRLIGGRRYWGPAGVAKVKSILARRGGRRGPGRPPRDVSMLAQGADVA
jgi:hypothetical protein